MSCRVVARFLAVSILLLAATAPAVFAQYRYGGGGGFGGEAGWIVELEGAFLNARNTDAVVATEIAGSSIMPIIPAWEDDAGGRLSVGRVFSSGTSISVAVSGFSTERLAAGGASGGNLAFAVGPPLDNGGTFVGDEGFPGSYDMATEVTTGTFDLIFGRQHELSERFSMEWSVGARFASFEETWEGRYDEDASFVGLNSYAVSKSNEGEMAGVRLGVRGRYRLNDAFSVGGGIALSMLDGELTAFSRLTPDGSSNGGLPSATIAATDDGRSGFIRDVDVDAGWNNRTDTIRLSLGWMQSTWEEIAADLVRNAPGTIAPLADRDSVTISGVKAGVRFRF